MKYNLLQFIKGIFIGAGTILPGISSGVFCVIFGIYEQLINSVLNFFKDYKKNIAFLLPIVLGAIIGIIVFGNLLKALFNSFYMQTCFCIIGFIIGGIPCLLKQNTKKLNITSIIIMLFTLFFSLYLVVLESTSLNLYTSTLSYNKLIISGLLMSAGIVIPGVSSTVILMLFGIYDIYLNAVSSINIAILLPMGIGLLIGGIIFLKIIQVLLKNFSQYTYYAIAGFTIGSIFVLFPGFNFDIKGIISIGLFIICVWLSYKMSMIKN